MNYKMLISLFAVVGMTSLGIVTGCSDSDSDDSASSGTTYVGPGSEWTMTANGTSYTFSMEDGSDSISVDATGSSLATGHTKLTVTSASATGSATAPSAGDVAHAIEVSGVAFLLKPTDANAETIAMVRSSQCPSNDFNANWVIGHRDIANAMTEDSADWFGTINWDISSGAVSFPVQRSVEDASSALGGEGSTDTLGSCSGGKVTWTQSCNSGNAGNTVYFTDAGVAIVSTCEGDTDESHIIGIPQPASGIAAITNLEHDYAGFMFDENSGTTKAIVGTMADGGGGTTDFTITEKSGNDLDTDGSSYTVNFTDSDIDTIANGMWEGSFTSPACSNGNLNEQDGTCEIVCMYSEDVNSSGKDMIYCVGQHPSDEDQRMTLLFVQN